MACLPVLSRARTWASGQLYLGGTSPASTPLCRRKYREPHPGWHRENPADHVGGTLVSTTGLSCGCTEPWLWGSPCSTHTCCVVGSWSSPRLAGSRRRTIFAGVLSPRDTSAHRQGPLSH